MIIGYRIASHKHRLSNVETVLGRSSLRASAATPSSTRPVRSKEAGVDVLSLDGLESLEQLLVRLPRQDRPLLAERVPHLNQGEIMHTLQHDVCCAGMRQDACAVLALLSLHTHAHAVSTSLGGSLFGLRSRLKYPFGCVKALRRASGPYESLAGVSLLTLRNGNRGALSTRTTGRFT